MTSTGPAFQELTGSCRENVPTPKAVSSKPQLPDGLTVLARVILVHCKPKPCKSIPTGKPCFHHRGTLF